MKKSKQDAESPRRSVQIGSSLANHISKESKEGDISRKSREEVSLSISNFDNNKFMDIDMPSPEIKEKKKDPSKRLLQKSKKEEERIISIVDKAINHFMSNMVVIGFSSLIVGLGLTQESIIVIKLSFAAGFLLAFNFIFFSVRKIRKSLGKIGRLEKVLPYARYFFITLSAVGLLFWDRESGFVPFAVSACFYTFICIIEVISYLQLEDEMLNFKMLYKAFIVLQFMSIAAKIQSIGFSSWSSTFWITCFVQFLLGCYSLFSFGYFFYSFCQSADKLKGQTTFFFYLTVFLGYFGFLGITLVVGLSLYFDTGNGRRFLKWAFLVGFVYSLLLVGLGYLCKRKLIKSAKIYMFASRNKKILKLLKQLIRARSPDKFVSVLILG